VKGAGNMTPGEEIAVIKQVLSGDGDAFGELVQEYEKPVFGYIFRMCGSYEDAADLSQDVFLKAYRGLESFHGDCRFATWLYRIANNTVVDYLRQKDRFVFVDATKTGADGETFELEQEDESFYPERILLNGLTRKALKRAISALSPELRQAFLLRECEGLSYEEIGEVLRISSGTVKSRIFRARNKLCRFLEKEGNIPEYLSSLNNGGERNG